MFLLASFDGLAKFKGNRITMKQLFHTVIGLVVFLALSACSDDTADVISGYIRVDTSLVSEIPRNPLLVIEAQSMASGSSKRRPDVVAVQRVRNPKFPLRYFLGPPDRDTPVRWPGKIQVMARLFGDQLSGDTIKPFALVGRNIAGSNLAQSVDILLGEKEPIQVVSVPSQSRPSKDSKLDLQKSSYAKSISGTITVSPSLGQISRGKVVFVIVRSAGVDSGPPLAVRRMRSSGFPLKYEVSEANVMIQGMPFQGLVDIIVRLDGDGKVGSQPGDLEGKTKQPVKIGDTSINVVLDRRH